MLKEDLILNALQNLTNNMTDMRKDQETIKLAIIKLETTVNDRIGYDNTLHKILDERLNVLEEFREDTGTHNLNEMKEKAAKEERESNNWRIWAIRGAYMIGVGLLSSTITGCLVFYITRR